VDVMDIQYVANGLFTIVGVMLMMMYQSVRRDIDKMKEDVHRIDVLVSGEYIKRSEVTKELEKIDDKLEKIFERINK
jgi:hypothetical protein